MGDQLQYLSVCGAQTAYRALSVHNLSVSAKGLGISDRPGNYQEYAGYEPAPHKSTAVSVPTLVFVHGFRGDHHGLLPIAEHVLIQCAQAGVNVRILIPDLPGFGKSAVLQSEHSLEAYGTWLYEFVEKVCGEQPGGQPVCVLGHSFGSLVVGQACETGLRTQRVALVNAIGQRATEGDQRLLTALTLAYYRLGRALPEPIARPLLSHPLLVRLMSEIMAKTHDRALRAWIHAQHARYFSRYASSRTLCEAFQASVSHAVADFLPFLPKDTILIAAERDDIVQPLHQLNLARRIEKRAQPQHFTLIPHFGHLLHYEAPDTVAHILVTELLEQLSVSSSRFPRAAKTGKE